MILCISVLSIVISPFSFLILLIWFFSFFSLTSRANGLPILFIFPKKQLLVLLIFAIVSFLFHLSALIFMISFLLLTLGSSFLLFVVALDVKLGYLFDVSLVSWSMLVLLWTFLLALLLLNPIGLGLSYFHFHLFLCIFWFSFWFLHDLLVIQKRVV